MKLSHITFQTEKFEEEVAFYQKYAGLTIQKDIRPFRNMVFLADEMGDTCIEVIEKEGETYCGNHCASMGFATEDVEKVREQLIADGYKVTDIISPFPHVKFFFTKDPAGFTVQFIYDKEEMVR